jgi:hypothetical protein
LLEVAKGTTNYAIIAQGGPSGLNPLRSDGARDGQAGGWTMLMVDKGIPRESQKTSL